MKAALRLAGAPSEAIAKGLGADALRNRTEPATRNIILTRDQVKLFTDALNDIDPTLGLFARTLAITGARPGSLAGCRLPDLDVTTGALSIPRSAKGRPGLRKHTRSVASVVPLPLAREIQAQADPATGLLFHAQNRVRDFDALHALDTETLQAGAMAHTWREAGRTAWSKNSWSKPVREAARRCHPALPTAVTLYTLRHSWAVELIQAGVSLREVAALFDTSVTMLERTYSREIGQDPRTLARLRSVQQGQVDGGR
jgi:integrase